MSDEIHFKDYERMVHQVSHKAHRRLVAAGVSTSYEDVFQDMCLTWTMARDGFNSNMGFKFSTYFMNAVWQNFNRTAEKQIRSPDRGALSIDASLDSEDADGGNLHDLIADNMETPEEIYEREEIKSKVLARLSPVARRALELIDNPPELLINELQALQAKAAVGRSRGAGSQAPLDINLGFIMRVMRLTGREKTALRCELEGMALKVSHQ